MQASARYYNQAVNALEMLQPLKSEEWMALGVICSSLFISTRAALLLGGGYLGYKWMTAKPIPSPNEVQSIHSFYSPTQTDLLQLNQYRGEIEELKKNPKVVGVTLVQTEGGLVVPVYIKYDKGQNGNLRFGLVDLKTRKEVGHADVTCFLPSNDYRRKDWIVGRPKAYEGYGFSQEEVSKLCVECIENRTGGFYKNVGAILYKAVFQTLRQECECRAIIDAVRGTHPYHYKMGFRSKNSIQNDTYARYVRAGTKPDVDLGYVPMYLPDRARELWLREIDANPIRFPDFS